MDKKGFLWTIGTIAIAALVTLGQSAPSRAAGKACIDFSVEIDTARNAYKDWKAYADGGSAEERSTAFDVFSHLLAVADESSADCQDAALQRAFNLLEMQKLDAGLVEPPTANNDPDPDLAEAEAATLQLLWINGLAKSDHALYLELKAHVIALCRRHGVRFVSPESGKVLVTGFEGMSSSAMPSPSAT